MNNIAFLIYESRSGSTLLAQKLHTSFNCFVAPESQLPINLLIRFNHGHLLSHQDVMTISEMIDSDRKIKDWGFTPIIKKILRSFVGKTIDHYIIAIFDAFLEKHKKDKETILILKKESYSAVGERLKKIYPLAKFLYIIRDPRGVFASKKNSIYTLTGKPFDTCPVSSSVSWVKKFESVICLRQKFPNDVFIVKYEDLIKSDSNVVHSISEFFGWPIHKSSRKIILNQRYNLLHKNLFDPLIKENDKKWLVSLTPKEIYFVETICQKYFADFNYGFSNIETRYKIIWKSQLFFTGFTLKIITSFRYVVRRCRFFKVLFQGICSRHITSKHW